MYCYKKTIVFKETELNSESMETTINICSAIYPKCLFECLSTHLTSGGLLIFSGYKLKNQGFGNFIVSLTFP